jgi:hypothetical protein
MRSDIVPGGTFPDYELPDHENLPRKLTEIQGEDPLILTLARGHYCPKEHQQHLELAANYLSKPGLREAWDAGDYSPFHGWDRRSPQSVPSSYIS